MCKMILSTFSGKCLMKKKSYKHRWQMWKEALSVWRNKITSNHYVSHKNEKNLFFTMTSTNTTLPSSHHLHHQTGLSVCLQWWTLCPWCGSTCPWCPHTRPQSVLLHHRSETQRSEKDTKQGCVRVKHSVQGGLRLTQIPWLIWWKCCLSF